MKLVDYRPAKALVSRAQLIDGMRLWHTHFCTQSPSLIVVTGSPYQYKKAHPGLRGTWWFTAYRLATKTHYSCDDCSLDGRDYNGNYLFTSEVDAFEWQGLTFPLYLETKK